MAPENDNQQSFDLSVHLSGEHWQTLRDISTTTIELVTVLSAAMMAAQLGVTVEFTTTFGTLAEQLRSRFTAELYPNVTITVGPVSGPPLET